MRKRSWTEQQLRLAAKDARSYRQILQRLGLRMAGGNYAQVKKYISDYGVAVALKGRGWNKGLIGMGVPHFPLEKILIRDSSFQSHKLKNRLFKEGLKVRECEECGWAEKSEDGRLPLELDHINGDSRDNRLENLRILCPNCHSLKPTHRGRNRKNKSAATPARVVEWFTHGT